MHNKYESLSGIEARLFLFIKSLHEDIKSMTPEDGFNSPRDYELVTQVNAKAAVLRHLENAMQVINPEFKYKEE